jgi:hypothetical protein
MKIEESKRRLKNLFGRAVSDQFFEMTSFLAACLSDCDWMTLEKSSRTVNVIRQQINVKLVPSFILITVEIIVDSVVNVFHSKTIVN